MTKKTKNYFIILSFRNLYLIEKKSTKRRLPNKFI